MCLWVGILAHQFRPHRNCWWGGWYETLALHWCSNVFDSIRAECLWLNVYFKCLLPILLTWLLPNIRHQHATVVLTWFDHFVPSPPQLVQPSFCRYITCQQGWTIFETANSSDTWRIIRKHKKDRIVISRGHLSRKQEPESVIEVKRKLAPQPTHPFWIQFHK